ncbi:MAG: hypothetical protein NZT61_01075 [Deltaproteobacteria bacterium]|nr:hypothetical protein [Deltaproteobacteria bacterium]
MVIEYRRRNKPRLYGGAEKVFTKTPSFARRPSLGLKNTKETPNEGTTVMVLTKDLLKQPWVTSKLKYLVTEIIVSIN